MPKFGVARAQDDLLDAEPDFVIAEFSVNDESTGHFEAWENVRQLKINPFTIYELRFMIKRTVVGERKS